MAGPASPSGALHLVGDPERAALARHTDDERVFLVSDPTDHAPAPTPRGGWWARLIARLKRSD